MPTYVGGHIPFDSKCLIWLPRAALAYHREIMSLLRLGCASICDETTGIHCIAGDCIVYKRDPYKRAGGRQETNLVSTITAMMNCSICRTDVDARG